MIPQYAKRRSIDFTSGTRIAEAGGSTCERGESSWWKYRRREWCTRKGARAPYSDHNQKVSMLPEKIPEILRAAFLLSSVVLAT